VTDREAETLCKVIQDFLRKPRLSPFGLRNSLVEFRKLLWRHLIIERPNDGPLTELLGNLALLRPVECLEQFDDLGLDSRHHHHIA
jgi:hypothetical protein